MEEMQKYFEQCMKLSDSKKRLGGTSFPNFLAINSFGEVCMRYVPLSLIWNYYKKMELSIHDLEKIFQDTLTEEEIILAVQYFGEMEKE